MISLEQNFNLKQNKRWILFFPPQQPHLVLNLQTNFGVSEKIWKQEILNIECIFLGCAKYTDRQMINGANICLGSTHFIKQTHCKINIESCRSTLIYIKVDKFAIFYNLRFIKISNVNQLIKLFQIELEKNQFCPILSFYHRISQSIILTLLRIYLSILNKFWTNVRYLQPILWSVNLHRNENSQKLISYISFQFLSFPTKKLASKLLKYSFSILNLLPFLFYSRAVTTLNVKLFFVIFIDSISLEKY